MSMRSRIGTIGLILAMAMSVALQGSGQVLAGEVAAQGSYWVKPTGGLDLSLMPVSGETASGEAASAELVLAAVPGTEEFRVTVKAEGAVLEGPASFVIPASGTGAAVRHLLKYHVQQPGEGKLSVSVEAAGPGGQILPVRRAELGYLATEEAVFHGDGAIDRKLNQLEKRRGAGQLSENEYSREKRTVLGGGAISSVAPQAAGGGGGSRSVTVHGTVLWTDSSGGTHPVRSATVEIRDEDLIFDDLVTTVTTNDLGEYTATFRNDSGGAEGGYDLYVRVLAKAAGFTIKSTDGDVHRIDSAVIPDVANDTSWTVDLTANNADDNNTAFSVHDAMVTAVRYVTRLNGGSLPEIDVIYPKFSGTSYYNGSELHVLQVDRWDWDVIHHEFGHYVADELNIENNPGGSHSSSENLAERLGKETGLRLAWGEGWPTYFAISLQREENTAAMAIPNVGDSGYQDTEDSTLNYDLEAQGGIASLGEDNELAVQRVLWDLYDGADDDGDQGVALGDAGVWVTLDGADAVNLSQAYQAFTNGKPVKEQAAIGCIYAEHQVAPALQTPPEGEKALLDPIPTFTWTAGGGGPSNKNDKFTVQFYDGTFTNLLFESAELTDVTFTPSQDEWEQILEGVERKIHWVVKGTQSNSPETGPYMSCARTLKKPPAMDLVLLVDTTGSMWDDIANVRASANTILDTLAREVPDHRVAVADYKDFPTRPYGDPSDYPYRAVLGFTQERGAITAAVNSLFASGGNDWPESVYTGLMGAISTSGLGTWRADAEKVIIVMGDAPPHDPEPFSGYTLAAVVDAARNAGVRTESSVASAAAVETAVASRGARIFSVVIGFDSEAYYYFEQLSAGTGGQVFRAATASQVSRAILEAIAAAEEEPEEPPATNQPPDVTGAIPSIDRLWPVNRRMIPVQILGVSDPDGDPVTITITGITQDEPVGREPDGAGVGSDIAYVRAERTGAENSRVYQIHFRAEDGQGGVTEGSTLVCVPHDQRPNAPCTDDGQEYDATAP